MAYIIYLPSLDNKSRDTRNAVRRWASLPEFSGNLRVLRRSYCSHGSAETGNLMDEIAEEFEQEFGFGYDELSEYGLELVEMNRMNFRIPATAGRRRRAPAARTRRRP